MCHLIAFNPWQLMWMTDLQNVLSLSALCSSCSFKAVASLMESIPLIIGFLFSFHKMFCPALAPSFDQYCIPKTRVGRPSGHQETSCKVTGFSFSNMLIFGNKDKIDAAWISSSKMAVSTHWTLTKWILSHCLNGKKQRAKAQRSAPWPHASVFMFHFVLISLQTL